jgi:Protein of unknown function (DUF3592)
MRERDWADKDVGFAAEDEMMPPGSKRLVAAVILAIVTLGVAAFGVYELKQGFYYSGWKSVPARIGKVDSKEITSGGDPQICVIATYRYQVKGKTYSSAQHSPSHRCQTFTRGKDAVARMQKLRAHPKVTAYYDPDRPERAALEPGASLDFIVGFLALAGSLIPLLIALLLLRAHRRHSRAHDAWNARQEETT